MTNYHPAVRVSHLDAVVGARGFRSSELHLSEVVQETAAHGQHLVAALEAHLRSFVVATRDVVDRAQVHDHRALPKWTVTMDRNTHKAGPVNEITSGKVRRKFHFEQG